ncbi:MAG: enoyl-CoA hydratase/isomerase family protein [Planctomycetes bacterium]|nr:enoyl-CoA hydratase/isomerase family protein [Planctomycetota bacterium]
MKYIKQTVEEDIGFISINNPPLNILSKEVFEEIYQCAKDFSSNQQVRAIVITAEGQVFAAGADIKQIKDVSDTVEGEKMCLEAHKVHDILWESNKPTIAMINGLCVGGGNELVMCCHFRIASDKARFGQPEIMLGIIPGLGGTQKLPRFVGVSKALELLLTGDVISAADAKLYGLVNMVIPETQLKRQTVGFAKKMTSKSGIAVAKILECVRRGIEMPLKDALKLEAKGFGFMMTQEDKKEGVQAFIEKRQPKFKS